MAEARSRPARPVLLVHGIQTDGKWQDQVAPLLANFFTPVVVRYNDFRRIGPIKIINEPVVLLVGLLSLSAYFFLSGWLAVAAAIVGVVATILSFTDFALSFRRQHALEKYYESAGDSLLAAPHVIAHSFGTYLTGRLLNEMPVAFAHRVILLGCVLPTGFDWSSLLSREKIKAVRNEFSLSDYVARLAGFAGMLDKKLGSAGHGGFSLDNFHRISEPNQECEHCHSSRIGEFHNVDCSGLGHSGVFISRAHAARYWLPFLWGMDSGEFSRLLRYADSWCDALRRSDRAKILELEDVARSTPWKWTGGAPLFDFLQSGYCRVTGKSVDFRRLSWALSQLCHELEAASRADFSTAAVALLNPFRATSKALEDLRARLLSEFEAEQS